MKSKISKWYKQGLWSTKMVHNAVEKGVLTEAEYQEIVGEMKEVQAKCFS